jgi:hypothetical protein
VVWAEKVPETRYHFLPVLNRRAEIPCARQGVRQGAAFGLLEQPHGFAFPAIDSAENAGQDDGRRERLRVVRATRPPAATAKLMRVVRENAEFSGRGIAVPPGDRVVGLVAEPQAGRYSVAWGCHLMG